MRFYKFMFSSLLLPLLPNHVLQPLPETVSPSTELGGERFVESTSSREN